MTVTYAEAIDWLFNLNRFGVKLGLENARALAEALGRPQDRFDSILVGGTNGKGSTAAMIHSILLAAGLKSALYSSPHLVRAEERIRIGDTDIDANDLTSILGEIRALIERLLASGRLGAHPTFFEVATAAAFVAFARAQVEVAVLEVGLGGRLDATNIVSPVLSIITNIDFDHQDILGASLLAIAREKAGILRCDGTALLGALSPEPLEAIRAAASAIGARLVLASDGTRINALPQPGPRDARGARTGQGARIEALQKPGSMGVWGHRGPHDRQGSHSPLVPREPKDPRDLLPSLEFAAATPVRDYPRLVCPLPGSHQLRNALVAIRAAEILDRPGRPIGAAAISAGLPRTRWPGRLEWVEGRPSLLLDGAHNPAGSRTLAEYLGTLGNKPVLLFGAMRDKETERMLEPLLPYAAGAVFTRPPMERAADPEALRVTARSLTRRAAAPQPGPDLVPGEESSASLARRGPDLGAVLANDAHPAGASPLPADHAQTYHVVQEAAAALEAARRLAGPDGIVVVCGSLFLVGTVKAILEGGTFRPGETP